MKTVTNVYILNLSIADSLFLFIQSLSFLPVTSASESLTNLCGNV